MKKLILITGSRSEYGLLKNLIILLNNDKKINLKLVVTGSHLSRKFGSSDKEIKSDGLKISKNIKILDSGDSPSSINKFFAKGVMEFSKYLSHEKPDSIIILGDRYEIFSAAISAGFLNIPIIHINGGDSTEGAIDEFMRHSITKMSWLHFVTNDLSKKRILNMGENPKNIFCVGSLGVERIKKTKFIEKNLLKKELKINLEKKTILITFHSETKSNNTPEKDLKEIISALSKVKETNLVFTAPNADTFNNSIFKMINQFIKVNKNCFYFSSLGFLKYVSLLNYSDCVLGNSSSGIIEAPTLKVPTINIGDRQKGRICAKTVINCPPKSNIIFKNIKKILSESYKKKIINIKNPYYKKDTSKKIYNIIKNSKKPKNLKKKFYFNEKLFN